MASRIGTQIAGYRIESRISGGGMGEVYLAEQDAPRRKVALKLLSPELSEDAGFRERFARESEAAASIDHPNVIPIYASGEADGTLFIAMRYVEGTDLRTLLAEQGPLAPYRAVHICAQIADALEGAHEQGLIHRDVKPANILVGRADHAYLSDFGLIRRSEVSTAITKTGQFMGTIDYVAPEQIKGQAVDGRADVYSLGCVLYECLTGEPPFRRETEVATLYAHLEDPPPKPSAKRPSVRSALDDPVIKAMAKSPNDRFDTSNKFADAAHESLRSPPKKRKARAKPSTWKAQSPHIGRGTIAVGLATITVITLGFGAWFLSRPSKAPTNGRPRTTPDAKSEEMQLLALVPASFRGSCNPTPGIPPSAATAVDCVSGDVSVRYTRFEDQPSMNDWFEGTVNTAGASSGDCATTHVAEGVWSILGENHGRVVCYQRRSKGESWIEWTDDRFLVLGHATRPDLGDMDLYRWWATRAGPWGSDGERRDYLPQHRIPSGYWTMSITRQDFVEQCCGLDTWPTEFVGDWILHLQGGRFEVNPPATRVGTSLEGRREPYGFQGSYVEGKEDLIHLYTTDPCGAYPDIFKWRVAGDRLYLEYVAACQPGQAPIPWHVHPWHLKT